MNKDIVSKKFSHALEHSNDDFGQYFLTKFFDLNFIYTGDTCTVEFDVEDFMYNPQMILHGGVIAFVSDVSMGHLCKKIIGNSVTVEMKVQYLKPATTGTLTCDAMFLKKGKRISFLESRLKDQEGNLIAMATGTFAKI